MEEAKEASGDQAQATDQGAEQDTGVAGVVKDLSKVDPKILQAEIDKAVQKAIRTREENLTRKQQDERAAAERAAAEQRGEYDRIKSELEAEKQRLREELVVTQTMSHLREIARDAGLLDMDDLALLRGEAVAEAVNEDGAIDSSKLKQLVERFRTDKPHKFQQADEDDKRRASRLAAPAPPQGQPNAEVPKGPDYYKNEGLDAYADERKADYERITSWGGRGDTSVEALAKALRARLKD